MLRHRLGIIVTLDVFTSHIRKPHCLLFIFDAFNNNFRAKTLKQADGLSHYIIASVVYKSVYKRFIKLDDPVREAHPLIIDTALAVERFDILPLFIRQQLFQGFGHLRGTVRAAADSENSQFLPLPAGSLPQKPGGLRHFPCHAPSTVDDGVISAKEAVRLLLRLLQVQDVRVHSFRDPFGIALRKARLGSVNHDCFHSLLTFLSMVMMVSIVVFSLSSSMPSKMRPMIAWLGASFFSQNCRQ